MNLEEYIKRLNEEKERLREEFRTNNRNINEDKIDFMARENLPLPRNDNDWK